MLWTWFFVNLKKGHLLVSHHIAAYMSAFYQIIMLYVSLNCRGLHYRPADVELMQMSIALQSFFSSPFSSSYNSLKRRGKGGGENNPPLCLCRGRFTFLPNDSSWKRGVNVDWMTPCLVFLPKEKCSSPLTLPPLQSSGLFVCLCQVL